MKEQPNYYANITADVLNADIADGAKLLYGRISALVNQEGFCWAQNQYFADLGKVDNRTIQKWLEQLKKLNTIKITYDNDTTHSGRRIYIYTNPTPPGSPPHAPQGVHINKTINTLYTEPEFKTNFKQPKTKKNNFAAARRLCKLFEEYSGSVFTGTHVTGASKVIAKHGEADVFDLSRWALEKYKPQKYQPLVKNPSDIGDHWDDLVMIRAGNTPNERSVVRELTEQRGAT